jgi:hypothetical protein
VTKRSSTTKDVALLQQLYKEGQLRLAPEFQRNSVWPNAAKSYLIDTIICDRPIPMLFFQRSASPQTGRTVYDVVDGQQRLRAIFDFLDNRLRLSETQDNANRGKRFGELPPQLQDRILNYDLVIEELSGYSNDDIADMFERMNRYVVRLSPQELRHAKKKGAFKDFVEALGTMTFWKNERVFSDLQLRRMKAVEFSAELVILLIEGPQDKKSSINMYYGRYERSFPEARRIESRLASYLRWIRKALPDFSNSRYRKPVDFYSLIGALHLESDQGRSLSQIDPAVAGPKLIDFELQTKSREPQGPAAQYVLYASRQTDNILPRIMRIDTLASLLRGA